MIETIAAEVEEGQSVEALEAQLNETHSALTAAQVKERLVSFEVCPRLVAEVISAWTGVPLAQLEGVGVDEETAEAIADWHYWDAQGYQL